MTNPTLKKIRLDVLVVQKGFCESREKAQALILAGKVLTGDRLLDKPGLKIDPETELRIRDQGDGYVSRGAHKLLAALDAFGLTLSGRICVDIGASTGGFTQVCLARGASKVYAIDVGHNQMHWSIRSDSRVVCIEHLNFRDVSEATLPEKAAFACVDVSFISLRHILPRLPLVLDPKADAVCLVKPQHEVSRSEVGKGGIVKDPLLHERVTRDIAAFAQSNGFDLGGLIESPLKGTSGNREFLMHLRRL